MRLLLSPIKHMSDPFAYQLQGSSDIFTVKKIQYIDLIHIKVMFFISTGDCYTIMRATNTKEKL